jgi:hypothetical protein
VDVEDSLEIFEHVHHPDDAQLLRIKKILVESAIANESRSTKKKQQNKPADGASSNYDNATAIVFR